MGVEVTRTALFAQKHALSLFCALAFALSWAYWLTLLYNGHRVEPGSTASHLPGLFGPCLAAIIVTALAEGPAGVRRFAARCVTLPPPRLRWLALAVSPLLFGVAVFAGLTLFGVPLPAVDEFNSYPGTPAHWPLAATALVAFVLNGIGEEGGWRGFALPRLAQGRSKLQACLVLTVIWLLWHAPLFALNMSMSALLGPALLGWALGLTAGSILLAWLYFRGQSILVVAIWHTSFNFLVATDPGRGWVASIASTVVILLGSAIGVHWWRIQARIDA